MTTIFVVADGAKADHLRRHLHQTEAMVAWPGSPTVGFRADFIVLLCPTFEDPREQIWFNEHVMTRLKPNGKVL